MAPKAISSEAANTAVGGSGSASSRRMARRPPSTVNIPGTSRPGSGGQAGAPQAGHPPRAPVDGRVEVQRLLGVAADVPDARVAEGEQVLGRGAPDGDVVDAHAHGARHGGADEGHRQPQPAQPVELAARERHGQDGDRVDPLAQLLGVEHRPTDVGPGGRASSSTS
jgi:hypothetical protein